MVFEIFFNKIPFLCNFLIKVCIGFPNSCCVKNLKQIGTLMTVLRAPTSYFRDVPQNNFQTTSIKIITKTVIKRLRVQSKFHQVMFVFASKRVGEEHPHSNLSP